MYIYSFPDVQKGTFIFLVLDKYFNCMLSKQDYSNIFLFCKLYKNYPCCSRLIKRYHWMYLLAMQE